MNEPTERRADQIESDIERTRAQMSSTIDAIQSKLTPGQMMDQALQYMRESVPAGFGRNLGNTVRNNPVPIALIGVGIAWLMVAGPEGRVRSRPDPWRDRQAWRGAAGDRGHEPEFDPTDTDFDGGLAEDDSLAPFGAASGQPAASYDSSGGATHRSGVGTMLREKAAGLKDKVADVGAKVRDMGRGARERLSGSGTAGTGSRLSGTAHEARRRAGDLGHRAREQYWRARGGVETMLEEQPLVLAAVGVAIGAALGAALPSTRREDEMLGHTRDRLLEGARQTAHEVGETVKESAHRLAETAREEADRMVGEVTSAARTQGNGRADRPHAAGGDERPGAAAAGGERPAGTTPPEGGRP